MRRRDFVTGLVALAGGQILAGCQSEQKNSSTNGGQRRAIRVAQWGQERYLIYLPFYIAQAENLFTARGIDVSLTFNGNDDQVFAAVLRGDAQFGIGDPIFAAISRNRGGDGVVVGQVVDRVALWGVSKRGGRTFAAPQDFAGARIGSFPRPSTTYTLLREMIDNNRVTGARIIEVPIGSEAALLERDAADVVMMLEPAASVAVEQGYQIVTSFPRLWGAFAFTGLTSTRSFVGANTQLVTDVRAAMQAALDLAHRNQSRAIAIARDLFPSLAPTVVESAVRRMLADQTLPSGFQVNPEGWSAAVRVRRAMGELPAADYSSVIA